jgi:mannose-6-phosphate isomerase-like protein (cupin superfamily)
MNQLVYVVLSDHVSTSCRGRAHQVTAEERDVKITPSPTRPAAPETSARRATPRPTYDGPCIVRRDETAHHVWGDTESGLVTDRVYLSSDTLHVLEFELGPGGAFRHSATNKTVFAADVMYCVLEGTLVIADPQHGEVQVVEAGERVLFGRDTWHHGFNPGQQNLRVLEFFAPPPSRGTASGYAKQQPMLTESRYQDERWALNWPAASDDQHASSRLRVIRDSDSLWGFSQQAPSHLVGVLADTEHLTVSRGLVSPGHVEDPSKVEDESLLVVTAGELWVDTKDEHTATYRASCLTPGDGVFLPRGTSLRVLVRDSRPASYVLGSGRPVPEGWRP